MTGAPTTADVVRLVGERFPDWRALDVVRVRSDGTVNAIFRVGDVAAVRVPLERGADADRLEERLRAEAAAMTVFGAVSTVPTPVPLAVGGAGDGLGVPWAVQSWIPGEVATPTGAAGSDGFALDLAALIRSLRGADTRGRRFTGDNRGGELRRHDAWVAECLRECELLPEDARIETARLRALWSRLRSLPRRDPDAMVHGDLTPPNLVVKDGRLRGVLDSGGFAPADPALDLVVAWHALDPGTRRVLRDAVGDDELSWRRGAAWALEQALGLVWYYRESLPGMSALGRRTLERLLDDPEL